MADGKSTGGSSWWQTLPGVLTGLAAIITAVTGLIVAFNHTTSRSEQVQPSSFPSSSAPTGAATTSRSSASGTRAGTQTVDLPALHQVKLDGGAAVITVLSAEVDPIDADRRSLKFGVRYMNAGRYPANFWSASFRLLVDDVPHPPTNVLDEVVASDSAKDGDVGFELPVAAKDVVLQISSGDEKSRLVFSLP
ncbi:MAG TPA: hypothetical protein VLV86_12955 [Vicinamibacterales bacterium]|nr:hypothetical protein [Vicinamibacterales bacterium]